MTKTFPWRREVACLLLGGFLGAGAVWACRPAAPDRRNGGPGSNASSAVSPSTPAGQAEALAAGKIGGKLRRLAREDGHHRAEEDWEAVAKALQAKGGDKVLAHAMLLRLNSAALGRLAAHLPAGPYTNQTHLLACEIYQRWGEVDFSAALAQAQTMGVGSRWTCAQQAILGFSHAHPAEVCEYLAAPTPDDAQYELRLPGYRLSLLGQTLENWSKQDPAAAGAFLLQRPALADRSSNYTVENMAESWALQDPRAAVNWAAQLPAKSREGALQKAYATWAQADLPASLAYWSSLPAGKDKDDMTFQVAGVWGKQNPQEAARWAETQGDIAASMVLNGWSQQDPAGAMAWATRRTATKFDPTSWNLATTNYVLNDPDGAMRWINSLPEGQRRDGAICSFSRTAGTDKDILTALNLLQTVNKPQAYAVNTAQLLNNWLVMQPDAAKQWINQANLPDSVLTQINKSDGP